MIAYCVQRKCASDRGAFLLNMVVPDAERFRSPLLLDIQFSFNAGDGTVRFITRFEDHWSEDVDFDTCLYQVLKAIIHPLPGSVPPPPIVIALE